MINCKNFCWKWNLKHSSVSASQNFLKGRTSNIFCCCRRAAQKESEGRMRPAGRNLPIPVLAHIGYSCLQLRTLNFCCFWASAYTTLYDYMHFFLTQIMHEQYLRSNVELQNARNNRIELCETAVMFQRGWLLPRLRWCPKHASLEGSLAQDAPCFFAICM